MQKVSKNNFFWSFSAILEDLETILDIFRNDQIFNRCCNLYLLSREKNLRQYYLTNTQQKFKNGNMATEYKMRDKYGNYLQKKQYFTI